MSGPGLFLSWLMLALIMLHLITRDRWSWRRSALVFGCLLSAVMGGIYAWRFANTVMARHSLTWGRVSEIMCKQVSVSLPLIGDSHDDELDDYA